MSLPKPRGKIPVSFETRREFFGGAGAALYARVLWLVYENISRENYDAALNIAEFLLDIFPAEEREKIEKMLSEVDFDAEAEKILPEDLPPERYRKLKKRLKAKLRLRYILRASASWLNRAMFLRGAPVLELK